MKHIIRILLIVIGSVSLAVGAIGILVPILPTTPFLMLAAICYVRSSKRLHHWLVEHRLFGRYIRSYIKYRAVSKSTKRWALLLLWSSMLLTLWLLDHSLVETVLIGIASLVSIYLLRLKTLTHEMLLEQNKL